VNFQTFNVDFEIVSKVQTFSCLVSENSKIETVESNQYFAIKSISKLSNCAVYFLRDFWNLETFFFDTLFEMNFAIISFPTPLKSESGVWISEVVSKIKSENPSVIICDLRGDLWPLPSLSDEFKEQVILISKSKLKSSPELAFMNFVLPNQIFSTNITEISLRSKPVDKHFIQKILNFLIPATFSKVVIRFYLRNHQLLSRIWFTIPYRLRSRIIRRLVDRDV
jgi:hypothetical protein